MNLDKPALIAAALSARMNAYAPYSVYSVGAAAVGPDGQVHQGCNVENASYGLTVCAERNAVARMVCSGQRSLSGLAVATEDGATPCGACRQVMSEFGGEETVVMLVDANGKVRETLLAELLPDAFRLD